MVPFSTNNTHLSYLVANHEEAPLLMSEWGWSSSQAWELLLAGWTSAGRLRLGRTVVRSAWSVLACWYWASSIRASWGRWLACLFEGVTLLLILGWLPAPGDAYRCVASVIETTASRVRGRRCTARAVAPGS